MTINYDFLFISEFLKFDPAYVFIIHLFKTSISLPEKPYEIIIA